MRLFIAIELSDEIKASLRKTQRELSAFDRAVRWVTADQMHLTLKFLGEVPDTRADDIRAATERIAQVSSPFEIAVGGCGCFPPKGRVRVVWMGVEEASGALAECNEHCESIYAEIGFERERRAFSPHLTLGRIREDKTDGRLREAVEAVQADIHRQKATEMCVVQSTLTPHGARYAIISRHSLKGGDAD
ncbi:MAG: RNA 2',3'-cyclic phosphodiesterase [Phycisphaerae bacterium]|nr:RNA 2',3'-cyclic phosphodiesterase [Phycisphaerae bacterium]